MVVTLMANIGVPCRGLVDLSDRVLAPDAGADDKFGDERLDLTPLAHDRNFLLVPRRFGEHAEIQHSSGPGIEVDDHIGVVQNIGPLAFIHFIQMIQILASRCEDACGSCIGDEVHQVEEMATFFDQSAAGVGVEAVPVVYLGEEREAVLANGDHANGPDCSGLYFFDQLCDGRHVAILEPDPDQGVGMGCVHYSLAVGDRGAQRLLDENGQSSLDGSEEDFEVSHVGGCDHQSVAAPMRDEIAMIAERSGSIADEGVCGL